MGGKRGRFMVGKGEGLQVQKGEGIMVGKGGEFRVGKWGGLWVGKGGGLWWGKNMEVNEHERLSNITLLYKLKERNSTFIAVLHFTATLNIYINNYCLFQVRTKDLGGYATTNDFTHTIIDQLHNT